MLESDGGLGLQFGRQRSDPEDAVKLLKLPVTLARFAIRALPAQALVVLTLVLTIPGVVGADEYLRLKALVTGSVISTRRPRVFEAGPIRIIPTRIAMV